jgi:hypothetical protein
VKRVGVAAAALALLLVPSAGAVGLSIGYTVTSGTTGDNGWYRSAVTIQITVQGATDTTCPSVKTFRSNADTPWECSATDGNAQIPLHLQFKIDTDAPSVTGATYSRAGDANGWFNKPIALSFVGADATSGIASCTSASYGGPDSASASVSGTCRDVAGNVSAAAAAAVKYDATAPSVTATPDRPVEKGGWYTKPVAVAFAGSDATSGIASCTGSTTYAGPDTEAATLAGSCVDNAGNSAPGSFALKYDATSPRLQDVAIVPGSDDVTLTWKQPADVTSVAVTRTPGRKGNAPTVIYKGRTPRVRDGGLKAGVAYRYRLTSLDRAGNESVTQVTAKLNTLYAPAAGKPAHAGTVLRWSRQKSATYYNLQLYRRGKKVLSTWPVGTSFRLPKSWSYAGHRYTLARGTYRWFIWPGRGARARAQYGPLLGSSTFVVH